MMVRTSLGQIGIGYDDVVAILVVDLLIFHV